MWFYHLELNLGEMGEGGFSKFFQLFHVSALDNFRHNRSRQINIISTHVIINASFLCCKTCRKTFSTNSKISVPQLG